MKITVQKVVKGLRYLKHYGFKEFVIRLQERMEEENVPYEPWYARHAVTEEELARQRKTAASWKDAPVISIVVPLYCTKEQFLREMIESVQEQSYPKWELCMADGSPMPGKNESENRQADGSPMPGKNESENRQADGSPMPGSVEAVVREYMAKDSRIVYTHLKENLGIADNTNAAIALASGDWIAFLDHDDLLAPDALFEAVSLMRQPKSRCGGLDATGLYTWTLQADGSQENGTRTNERHAAANDEVPFDMIYTDEDKVDMDGKVHFQPHFKPDINIDLLRSNNYITHFLLVKRSLLEKVGGIRKNFDGAQDYDFILRCVEQAERIGHVPRILYHWRCHKESTSDNPFSKQYAVDAGKRAIEGHLERMGVPAEVTPRKDMGFFTVKYQLQAEPLVSIIIPSKDEVESLKKCLSSIEKSSYSNYEVIIVENNSSPETFAYYRSIAPMAYLTGTDELRQPTGEEKTETALHSADVSDADVKHFEGTLSGGQRLCVAVWKDGFNYSKLNNFGASHTKGDYYVLMNNDIEMMQEGWLEEMLATCQRREVGIVGAKLYYPDKTVQHAGIVVGIGGNARGIGQNMFIGLAGERSGYMHKASLTMNYSAVTAACLMVKREIYEQVGGFEEKLAVAFNDVDFCLKVRALGYLVVYQPRIKAWHYESKSRGAEDSPEKVARFQREIDYMRDHWIAILKNGDPYYNPNLSSVYPNYSLKDNSR